MYKNPKQKPDKPNIFDHYNTAVFYSQLLNEHTKILNLTEKRREKDRHFLAFLHKKHVKRA